MLEDQLNGITLAVPDGWVRATSSLEEGATIYTDETYDCPAGGSSLCRRGRVSSLAANTSATTAEAVAKEDISRFAEKIYGEDTLGNRPHGGIESHKVLKSQNFAVAGRAGYLVRWQVVTGAAPAATCRRSPSLTRRHRGADGGPLRLRRGPVRTRARRDGRGGREHPPRR
ncbi:hypothetical protein [Streptomyces sp. SJL17-1]|uniref:hypothetical protein n=1 Tax=Streptomyces sp. SJL17-1 TaxID=2967223 RepID=UPI00296632E0|nr:hypothetical protein [Streptomyces sp. SJL17-1]